MDRTTQNCSTSGTSEVVDDATTGDLDEHLCVCARAFIGAAEPFESVVPCKAAGGDHSQATAK